MTNEERRNIVDRAKAQGYQGSYVDLFRQAAANGGADPMLAAMSSQDRAEGLAPYHEAGMHDVGMTFPDVGPNEPMNTMRTKVPIDIKKYDDKTGHLVASHLSVPPGMTNVDSGPRRGTVVETPSRRQKGGPKEDYNMARAKELGYKRDTEGHLPSVDHETGMLLKSKEHPTVKLEFMSQMLSPERKMIANPTGYFGENQLQYVPRNKKQKGGPKFAYEGQKTRMSSDITPEQAEMLMANQINVLPEVEIGGEATTPRAKAVAQANQALGMEGGNQMRDMLEGMEEADRAAGIPMAMAMGFAGGAPLLAGAASSLPAIGETILGTNAAVAQGGARLTQGVNAASSTLGRSQVGQVGSRFLANTELGQGIRAAGQMSKFVAGKVGQAGQAINNAVLGTRAGQAISSVYNAPINIMSGMRAADAVKLGVTIQGIQSLPKVPGYVASGQLGKAASTMLKVPGLKAAPVMSQMKTVKTLHDASAGAQAAAGIGSAEDLGDVAAATKMLPGTSGLRTIASGIDAVTKKTGGYVRLQEGNYKSKADQGEQDVKAVVDKEQLNEKFQEAEPDYSWSWWDGSSFMEKAGKVGEFFLNPAGTLIGSAIQEARHRIANNISPYGYGDAGSRLIDAVIQNKPQEGSKAYNKEKNQDTPAFMQERTDLLHILLGEDQEFNSIPESEYKPSKSSGSWFGPKYYASPITENWIRRQIEAKGADAFINQIDRKRDPETGLASHYWKSHKIRDNVLGNYIIDVGEDEKGKYISYYDKWDLNPFSGDNAAVRMAENATQGVLGISPPEIYGRVYLRKGGFLKRPSGI
jgi:hypothetical protein